MRSILDRKKRIVYIKLHTLVSVYMYIVLILFVIFFFSSTERLLFDYKQKDFFFSVRVFSLVLQNEHL